MNPLIFQDFSLNFFERKVQMFDEKCDIKKLENEWWISMGFHSDLEANLEIIFFIKIRMIIFFIRVWFLIKIVENEKFYNPGFNKVTSSSQFFKKSVKCCRTRCISAWDRCTRWQSDLHKCYEFLIESSDAFKNLSKCTLIY